MRIYDTAVPAGCDPVRQPCKRRKLKAADARSLAIGVSGESRNLFGRDRVENL